MPCATPGAPGSPLPTRPGWPMRPSTGSTGEICSWRPCSWAWTCPGGRPEPSAPDRPACSASGRTWWSRSPSRGRSPWASSRGPGTGSRRWTSPSATASSSSATGSTGPGPGAGRSSAPRGSNGPSWPSPTCPRPKRCVTSSRSSWATTCTASCGTTPWWWCSTGTTPASAQAGAQLLFPEAQEALLVRAYLGDEDLVVAGVHIGPDGTQVALGIGPAGHGLGGHVLRHQRRHLLEVLGAGELLGRLAGDAARAPTLVGEADGILLVRAPADLHPSLSRALPPCLTVALDGVGAGAHVDVAVPDLGRQADGPGAEARDVDGKGGLGPRVEAGVLHRVVVATVAEPLSAPQAPHDLHRLGQHLLALGGRGPAVAQDVLVQGLAAAHAQREAALQHERGRGCRLGHHGGMDAHRGARHGGGDVEPGSGGDATDHRPHEGGLSLGVVPGVVVVREPDPVEADLLGQSGVADHLPGAELLAGEEVAEGGHELRPAAR